MDTTKTPWRKKDVADTIFDLIDEGGAKQLAAIAETTELAWLKEYEDEAMESIKHEGEYQGVPTGFQGIDMLLGSFLPGELFTLGGDTGHGKSLLGMNIAQNAYKSTGKPVLMVNLELTRTQAVSRFYNISGEDHDYSGILIQRAPAVSYRDIDILMAKAKEEGVCLVVIDHLHFFDDSTGDNQATALTRIMKHFKECAVQHELPVLLLSHVTPHVKPDGSIEKPGLHSFRGSKSIQQISDMVGFVFREKDDPKVEFYMRKMRSRQLNQQSTYLNQIGWKLEQDTAWLPQKFVPSGESSPVARSASSQPNVTALNTKTQSRLT